MAELEIESRSGDGLSHVVLSGEFDLAGVVRFEDTLAAIEAETPKAIVIDLSELEFMDSSGLRALVNADGRAQRAGRRLAIVPGPPQVRRVFEITQLDGRLDLVDDPSAISVG